MSRDPIYQDVMGQFPQLKTYNHGVALYKIDDNVTRESIVKDLEDATAKIEAAIPWLTQQVVHEGIQPGHSGTFRVKPWPSHLPPNRLLRVKDCTDLCPSYSELSAAQCPVHMLDGSIICPVPGFPLTYSEASLGPAPACLITLNFVRGGALLTFSNQHNVMDGTGIFQVVGLLALVLNGGAIPPEAIEQGNRDPSTVVPLYHPDEPILDHSHLLAVPAPPAPLAPAKWANIRFLRTSLPSLKSSATDPSSGTRVSTGDAVSALYWSCLARARLARGQEPSAVSKFSRTIDSRGALGVPASYMGQMVYSSATWLSFGELAGLPLSAVASRLRRSLEEANTEHAVRSYATFLSGVADKATLAYTGPFDRARDVASSSMARAELVLRFGKLGRPEFIRRPDLRPVPGALYFYPPEKGGDLNLLVCLDEYEMGFLRADETWAACTEFIG